MINVQDKHFHEFCQKVNILRAFMFLYAHFHLRQNVPEATKQILMKDNHAHLLLGLVITLVFAQLPSYIIY